MDKFIQSNLIGSIQYAIAIRLQSYFFIMLCIIIPDAAKAMEFFIMLSIIIPDAAKAVEFLYSILYSTITNEQTNKVAAD